MRPISEIEDAIRRLTAGHSGPMKRWDGMSFSAARVVLEEAVEELGLLRAKHEEWLCESCQRIYPRQRPPTGGHYALYVQRCPECDRVLSPHIVAMHHAYQRMIDQMRQRIELLEEVARTAYDLTDQ